MLTSTVRGRGEGVTMARKKQGVTLKMLEAVNLLASGMYYRDVAKEVGVSERSLYRWMDDPLVMAEYRKVIERKAIPMFGKALTVFERQMDSKKDWLAHSAAREASNRFAPMILGTTEHEHVVRFEEGQSMPKIGVPSAPEDE